jgi:hypothetical protein
VAPFDVCLPIAEFPWLRHLFSFQEGKFVPIQEYVEPLLAFLLVLFFFFLSFLLGMLSATTPKTASRFDDISMD